jgi:PKD repeat protein
VQFTAGTLQSAGYTVLLVTGSWAGTTRTWILVGVPLSSGLGYIPVEAVPSAFGSSSAMGQTAWQDNVPDTSFDSRYLDFTQATALVPNSPPTVTLSIAGGYAVAGETATLMVTGSDPDGVIFAYLWTFSDGTAIAGTQPVLWYTFRKVGNATVTLTAIDTRGARMTQSVVAEVLAEEPDCGCGH